MQLFRNTHAVSRVVTGLIIVIVLAGAAIAGIVLLQNNAPRQSASSSTSNVAAPSTLAIDDWNWPTSSLNVLYSSLILVWPFWLEYTVYQPLITVNVTAEFQEGRFQYLPVLAENWTVSSDSRIYTMNLRQGVTFSNGDPFNSYQVWAQMYATYYLLGNSSAWLESYAFFDMSNVKFGPSTISLLNQSGLANPSQQVLNMMMNSSWPIYVTSPYQIVFHLQSPFAWFPGTLVSYAGLIYDVQYVLDHGGFGTPGSINSYFNHNQVPGTGPYLVTGISESNYVSFSQNPSYWGNSLTAEEIAQNPLLDPGHVKNVVIYYKSDDLARYTDLSTGAVQISAISAANWNLVLQNPDKYAYWVNPEWSPEVTAVALNTQLYPTNITDVRLAIVHAINYTDIYQKAFFGQVSPLVGPEYPAWDQFYNLINAPPYQYNVTLAQQYLAEAHITNMPTLTYRVLSGCQFCSTIAQGVQHDLSVIGINVNIEISVGNAFWSPYGTYSYDLQSASQMGQLNNVGGNWVSPLSLTPADYWLGFVSNRSVFNNFAVYSNPVVEKAVDAFTSSDNITYIQSLLKVAQAQVYNDAPYAWIGSNRLWNIDGSLVWDKSVVKSFYLDPLWAGNNEAPLFNTVTWAQSSNTLALQYSGTNLYSTVTSAAVAASRPSVTW